MPAKPAMGGAGKGEEEEEEGKGKVEELLSSSKGEEDALLSLPE